MGREFHLNGTNIEDSDHILLESIAKDVKILRRIITTIINAGNTDVISVVVSAGVQNHVKRIDGECGTANGNGVSWGRGIAINDVSTLVIAIYGSGIKGSIHSVSDRGGVVVQSGAGVDLAHLVSISDQLNTVRCE